MASEVTGGPTEVSDQCHLQILLSIGCMRFVLIVMWLTVYSLMFVWPKGVLVYGHAIKAIIHEKVCACLLIAIQHR